MRNNFRRLCAALTGITVLMSGMCMPQYTATAYNEADYANYPVSYAPGMEPNVLLKTVEADLSEGNPVLTLSGEELQGQVYDLIFAKVYYQPAEEKDVPEGTERLATHAIFNSNISRICPDFQAEPDMPPIPGAVSNSSEQEFCKLRRENEYALTAVKKIDGFEPETDSLELTVSFMNLGDAESGFDDVNCGKCAVQFYGFNYEKLPDEAYLTEICSTEYQIGSKARYLEFTDADIKGKMYANYYVKAEYVTDPAEPAGASVKPAYAELNYMSTKYHYIEEPATPPPTSETDEPVDPPLTIITSDTTNEAGSRYEWVRRLDDEHYSVIFSLDRSEQSYGFSKDFSDRLQLETKIECLLLNETEPMNVESVDNGFMKLTLYGYDPFSLPPSAEMTEIVSAQGELTADTRLNGVTESLSLSNYDPLKYYLTFTDMTFIPKTKPVVAGTEIKIIRDLTSPTGTKKEQVVTTRFTSPINLENGFGVVEIGADELPIQPGDRIEISTAAFDSEGKAVSGEKCKTALYSYGKGSADVMPDVAKLTLLGETTIELSADTVAASVEIGSDLLYKTGFTDYYAYAEYDGSETLESFAFGTEETTVIYKELGGAAMEGPDGELIETPPTVMADTSQTFSNRQVDAIVNSASISLGRPELGGGSIKITAVGLTGDTQATSGKLTVKVYGYNRYEMPDYADMDELLLTASGFYSGHNYITYDDAYQTLWIQTRHVAQINDGETWKLTVTHADGSETETPLEWNMINGTRIAKIDPAEIGLSNGDKLTVERQYGKLHYPQAEADKELGWQIAIYGEKAADPALKLGDVDCSGGVDVADAVLVARFVVEDREAVISRQGLKNADVNRSGGADPEDITLILRYIARIITEF